MLYKKNKYISNIYTYINETIDILLNEQIKVISLPEGAKLKKIYIKVEGNNYTGDYYEVLDNGKKEVFHEKIDDVKDKFNKKNVKENDEFEHEIVVFDDSKEEGLLDYLTSNKISVENLGKTYTDLRLAGPAVFKTSGKIIRLGTKTFLIGKKGLKMLGKIVNTMRGMKRKEDEKPHSLCYCLKLTQDGVDDKGNLDRGQYSRNISDQSNTIYQKLMDEYDYCVSEYGSYIDNSNVRVRTKKSCVMIDDYYSDSKSLIDDIISNLQSVYDVKGYNKKGIKKTEKKDTITIGEKLTMYKKISLEFSENVEYEKGNVKFDGGVGASSYRFNIVGTWRDNREDTMILERSGEYYIFGFSNARLQDRENGGVTFHCSDSSCTSRKNKSSNKTRWKGKITDLID